MILKKGDRGILRISERRIVTITSVNPIPYKGHQFDYIVSSGIRGYWTYAMEDDMIPIPKGATKDQIEAIKSLIV